MLRKIKKNTLFCDWNYSRYYGFRSPWTLGSLSWSAMRMWYLDTHMYRYNIFTNVTYFIIIILNLLWVLCSFCLDCLWKNICWLLLNHSRYSWPALLVACISCLMLTCWIMYSFINMFIFFKLGVIECVLQKVICKYRHLLPTTFTKITN